MRTLAIALTMSGLLLSTTGWAQNYVDLIRYSRPDDLGSARYTSMAGAFSALGNDFSATSMNPAGIAVYRHSELSTTLYYRNTQANTQYYENGSSYSDGQLRFSQIGVVSHTNVSSTAHFNYGFRYNRTNDYGFEQRVAGFNMETSILDQWELTANYYASGGENLADQGLLYEDMANDVGLIAYQNNAWSKSVETTNISQTQAFNSRGGKGIFAMDFGYQDKGTFNIGGSIEIPTLSYSDDEVYKESGYLNSSYTGMTWRNTYDVTGVGFQLKAGILWTPENLGRISIYLHSPIWWSMAQEGETVLTSHSSTGNTVSRQPFNTFFWQMTTPVKVGAGYAYVFKKFGLISVDYAYQDMSYANAKSNDYPGSMDYVNEDIDSYVSAWHDIRVGGELRLDKMFIRAGYHLTTTPFTDSGSNAKQYSGGVGYKANKWGIDVAYSLRQRSDEFFLYSDVLVDAVTRSRNAHYFIGTLYFRI